MPQKIDLKINSETGFKRKRVQILSLAVDVSGYKRATGRILQMTKTGNGGGYVCFANVHMTMEAFDNERFAEAVNRADLVLPDGKPLFWMQKLLGAKTAEQTRGPAMMPLLCRYAEKNNLKVGFYGGKRSTLNKLRNRLTKDFPRLQVNYLYSPPFRRLDATETSEIVKQINQAEIDILFVCLGCPKQEIWMAEHTEKINSVMLGVGASIDFYAGEIREAPKILQKIGLEWLYRLIQEPGRLWHRYLLLNPRFIFQALLQLSGLKKNRRITNAADGN